MKALRLTVLWATACCLACAEPLVGPGAASDHGSLFDDMWHQVDLHYSFFDLKHIDWDSIGNRYRPLALAASSDAAFADVLGRMLAELKDVHVSITSAGVAGTTRYLSARDTAATYFSTRMVLEHYLPVPRQSVGGHFRYGMLAPTVGYIYIASFEGNGWAGEMDGVIGDLKSATSVVIDVRNNSGGNYLLAADVAGRFADRKRTFGYVRRRNGPAHNAFTDDIAETIEPEGPAQFRGPVFVLANRRAFSSAEDFVLAMHALPSTVVVGDTTAGASGGPIVRELANGWTYQLSEWIEYTADHRTFEGVGLAPDITVRETAADAAKGIDSALERAMLSAGVPRP